jgi:hypothetical protein
MAACELHRLLYRNNADLVLVLGCPASGVSVSRVTRLVTFLTTDHRIFGYGHIPSHYGTQAALRLPLPACALQP